MRPSARHTCFTGKQFLPVNTLNVPSNWHRNLPCALDFNVKRRPRSSPLVTSAVLHTLRRHLGSWTRSEVHSRQPTRYRLRGVFIIFPVDIEKLGNSYFEP